MVSCRKGGFLLARAVAALEALQIPHGTVRLLFKLTGSLQQPPLKCHQVLLCCWRHVLLVPTSMNNPSCSQRQHQAWHISFNVCILCCM